MSNDDVNIFDDVVISTMQPIEIFLLLLSIWLTFAIIMIGIETIYEERRKEKPQNVFYKTAWTITFPIYSATKLLIISLLNFFIREK